MKILVLQETDWIKRGPHQQHHLMDRMALRGHEIRVSDHEYLWREDKERKIITGRKDIRGAGAVCVERRGVNPRLLSLIRKAQRLLCYKPRMEFEEHNILWT